MIKKRYAKRIICLLQTIKITCDSRVNSLQVGSMYKVRTTKSVVEQFVDNVTLDYASECTKVLILFCIKHVKTKEMSVLSPYFSSDIFAKLVISH